MANLALKKLPVEQNKWTRPEVATNGKTTPYNKSSGYAYAKWPCTYTLDLGKETLITQIRFLLWDDLGDGGSLADDRKYKFSLSLSSDGTNYTQIFSNQHQSGSNGWFSFSLPESTQTRFIKLVGHFNSVNNDFHIVEFEIHNKLAPKLNSTNIHNYNISAEILNSVRYSEVLDSILGEKQEVFTTAEYKLEQLNSSIQKTNDALDQIELIKKSIDFSQESNNNKIRADYWLYAAAISFLLFMFLLFWFVFCDSRSYDIIHDSVKKPELEPYTTLLLSAYYTTKAILLSTLLFVFGWFLKNYRSEKHNYVINKHKAMSLTVATSILTRDEYKDANRAEIFNQSLRIILEHQASGFSKEDTTSPSIMNTIVGKSTV